MQSTRRSFLIGLGAALVAAPAIVRAGSLMPIKVYPAEPLIRWSKMEMHGQTMYFMDGVSLFKSTPGGGWVNVSSEYYI